MQNQALPKSGIGEAYYFRQLWYHTFGIVIHTLTKRLIAIDNTPTYLCIFLFLNKWSFLFIESFESE